jgi:hypothetical protein
MNVIRLNTSVHHPFGVWFYVSAAGGKEWAICSFIALMICAASQNFDRKTWVQTERFPFRHPAAPFQHQSSRRVRLRVDASFANLPEPLSHPAAPSIFISLPFINLQIPLPATPFFSHLYKPPGVPYPFRVIFHFLFSIFPFVICFQQLANSFPQLQNPTSLSSSECQLFGEKHRGGTQLGMVPQRSNVQTFQRANVQTIFSSFEFRSWDVQTFGRSDALLIYSTA